jgi:hypothetical protein
VEDKAVRNCISAGTIVAEDSENMPPCWVSNISHVHCIIKAPDLYSELVSTQSMCKLPTQKSSLAYSSLLLHIRSVRVSLLRCGEAERIRRGGDEVGRSSTLTIVRILVITLFYINRRMCGALDLITVLS